MTKKESGVATLIECKSGYVFNSSSREYIVFLKNAGKNVIVPEALHKALMKAYVDDMPVDEIAVKFTFPSSYIPEYKTIFGWKRRGIAITDEDALELSVEDASDKMLEEKKFEILQEYNKKSWHRTLDMAKKWDEFQIGELKPFEQLLETWKPKCPRYTPKKECRGYNLVVVLSDCHYGCESNGKQLFRKKGHSTNYTVSCVKSYYQRIIDDIKNLNLKIESLTILSLGDQIHSSNPYSQTTKGTTVKSDFLGEEMFDVAFDSVTEFVYNLSREAPKTKVIAMKGNHCGQLDLILFKTLSVYFKDQTNITFDLVSAPAKAFREKNTLCIASHGAHDSIKAKFTPGPKLQSYVQSLIIHSQETEDGITSRAAFFADLHHSEMKEYNDFTYHLCPSVVVSDEYSDGLGLYSRSAQSAFLIDEKGIKMSLNYYFD